MIKVAVYSTTNGEIKQTMLGPEESMLSYMPQDGCAVMQIGMEEEGGTHYIADGAVVPVPVQPSADHVWNPNTHVWEASIADAKVRLMQMLKRVRDTLINDTFTWNGHVFDCDQVSQTRILGLFTTAISAPSVFPIDWRLADNSWVSLSVTDAMGVWTALQSNMKARFIQFAVHEATVGALTTLEQVQGYDILSGWV